jgi:hypothetical protein
MRSALLAAFALIGCASTPASPPDAFFANLRAHCGKAYEGRIVANTPPGGDFEGKRLVMHVRDCTPREIRVPFHVGDNRSRTWVLTRTADGVRLKHDHRHEDGSPDTMTMYGGDTAAPGSETRQEFPADAESKALFTANNLAPSVANVWTMEFTPTIAAYELRRPNRLFRVEFDLTRPVPAPPPPWGWGAE